ncbi:MAG: pyridoxine 5'-phosphate synthase [Bdellovibrionota bacterium]
MIRLGINIDHIATVRQARMTSYPDPVHAAALAELGGANNITCHLREDRRHIQDRDVKALKDHINIPLNFEMAATKEMIQFACELKPHAITLVPEKREELTTEGGLNIKKNKEILRDAIAQLNEEAGSLISLFVDANQSSIELTKELGAHAVEIHTGEFCEIVDKCKTTNEQIQLINKMNETAEFASTLGLQVHLGHGITYNNAHWFQYIEKAEEANIGHSVIARAMFVGLKEAVAEMKDLLNNPKYKI